MAKKKTSLTEAVSGELKANFNLDKFKEKKLLNNTVKFKEQKWIPFSEALQTSAITSRRSYRPYHFIKRT
jgi:hypothetical protein